MLCMVRIIVHLSDLQRNEIFLIDLFFLLFKVNLHFQVGRQCHILNSNSWDGWEYQVQVGIECLLIRKLHVFCLQQADQLSKA